MATEVEIAVVPQNNNEEERMRDLYEAAQKGCVSTLNTLLQQDPLILYRLGSQTTFYETPLHISALLGHLEFTKTLVAHKPKLALELDSSQHTPLHLASAEGHVELVKELLRASGEACLVRDQEHRIPLHYAVIRGRRDVVLELIRAKPESLKIVDEKGKNVFHLCVMYNQMEILKDLVALLDTHDTHHQLLVERDLDGGNTILHLAVMSKQVETVRYLISIPKIRSEAKKLKNDVGHSVRDTAERIPQDSKSLQIQAILMQHCGMNFGKVNKNAAAGTIHHNKNKNRNKALEWFRNMFIGDSEWVQQMRGNLSLVPAIVSTVTYQAAVNPPGGVIQPNINENAKNNTLEYDSDYGNWLYNGPLGCLWLKDKDGIAINGICPGQAVFAFTLRGNFNTFIIYNTIAFVTSLIVAFLLLSGIPLKSKSMTWVLTLGMLSNLTFLLNAYFASINLITPNIGPIDYGRIILIVSWFFNSCFVLIALCIVVLRLMGILRKSTQGD